MTKSTVSILSCNAKRLLLIVLGIILGTSAAFAQPKAAPHSVQSAEEKAASSRPLQFEVVSIRRNKSGGPSALQALPDGYRAINVSLGLSIMTAYLPKNLWLSEPIQGEPDWIHQEMYDVVAKIAPSDIPEWQKQNDNHNVMLEAMLQSMLAERCKLVVHHIPREAPAWALVVDKQGPKFKPMKPGETPDGQPVPDQGEIVGFQKGAKPQVSFFGYSMDSFAAWLSQSSPMAPVIDKTGLAGRYDLVASQIDLSSTPNDKGVSISLGSSSSPANIWDLKALGLKLQPIKIPLETLVIDHIERPTPN
jgi:bla regulator protein BlaR1